MNLSGGLHRAFMNRQCAFLWFYYHVIMRNNNNIQVYLVLLGLSSRAMHILLDFLSLFLKALGNTVKAKAKN